MLAEQKLAYQASSARLIHLAEQEIFPFLEERIALQTQQLANLHKEGKDCNSGVAYLAALLDLKNELILKMRRGDSAAAKLQV